MKLPIYQIDAFANNSFEGNPAAICPLERWLPDKTMQSIAEENNLSETAFFVPTKNGFHIRWFTPVAEVDLCGHATLASAYVIFTFLDYKESEINFESRSGLLKVTNDDGLLVMNFPSQRPIKCNTPEEIIQAFNYTPIECLKAEDYIVVFNSEELVYLSKPNLELLKKLDLRGVAITAKSDEYDFVARFFAPKYGINEDPVTGSAYTQLAPYWSSALSRSKLRAKQVSSRGGELLCQLVGNRVYIAGRATTYLTGKIRITTK
jgi:PhzF family phenazine biosynthesis protein